jgi:hypothetical protein
MLYMAPPCALCFQQGAANERSIEIRGFCQPVVDCELGQVDNLDVWIAAKDGTVVHAILNPLVTASYR